MFREVTRIKQALSKEECISILKEELRGILSLNGEDGYPYGVPLNHYYDADTNRLYFHSGKTGYKMECMREREKASFCVLDKGVRLENDWAYVFRSVIAFGKIGFVEEEGEIRRIARLLSLKFNDDEEFIEKDINRYIHATAMFYLQIEHMTGKRVTEN